tara:strand:- start:2243 stop:2755 length:513 start_codon:yes stop_codon:yes gene_type:complete
MSDLFNPQILPWLYSIGLLILGFVLILLEIFIIPGVNIFGIMGFGTVCVAVVLAYTKLGIEAAVVIGLLGVIGTAALVWFLIRNRAWQRLVLETETDKESGYESAPMGFKELTAQKGIAVTPLRPSGRAQFGDRVVDVVTEGDFINTGCLIEVLQVSGNRVVVALQVDYR